MNKRLIDAHYGTGSSKVFAGQVEVWDPKTFAECIEAFGSEAKTIEYAMRSYIIEKRVAVKAKPKTPLTAIEKLFNGLSAEQQAAAMEAYSKVISEASNGPVLEPVLEPTSKKK